MNAEEWQQAWQLYRQGAEVSEPLREDWLASNSAPAHVLAQVRQLLAEETNPELEEAAEPETEPVQAGTEIGPYRILRSLGAGAMGTVYLAEQQRPLRRKVALKLVSPGLKNREMFARFEIERRVLALMEHPGIAKVFDAGTTSAGQPYFVMEYVSGSPITTFCEANQCSLEQRLELLIAACQAIHHAHQKGIIHRDVKPRNILVTTVDGRPTVKVIDFGVARAVEAGGEGSLATNFGSLVGTISYMSPEQASLDPGCVDVRSDVYSAGVVAYQVIAGQTPFAAAENSESFSLVGALQIIRSQQPPPPSRVAPARSFGPELDWIVMKALEKEPARRYQTAQALALDLQRYLEGEPVEAGRPSQLYWLRKRAWQQRWWLATAAAFVGVLLTATWVSTAQAVRATAAEQAALHDRDRARRAEEVAVRERDRALRAESTANAEAERARLAEESARAQQGRANRETVRAQAVSDFLQNDLLLQASPHAQAEGALAPNPNITVRELLERASSRLATKFPNQPLERAALENTIAAAFQGLGYQDQALLHSDAAATLRAEHLGSTHPETLEVLDRKASALQSLQRFAEAETLWRKMLATQQARHGAMGLPTLAVHRRLGGLLRAQEKYPQAQAYLARTLADYRRHHGDRHPESLRAAAELARCYTLMSRHADAENMLRFTLENRKSILGTEHPETLTTMLELAQVTHYQNRLSEAEQLYRTVLSAQKRVLGPTHPDVLRAMSGLGSCLTRMGRLEESITVKLQQVELESKIFGERHGRTLNARHNLAAAYDTAGDLDRAIPLYQQVLQVQKEGVGPNSPSTLLTMFNLGVALREWGRVEDSLRILETVVATRRKVLGPDHAGTLMATSALAAAYADAGQPAQALPLAESAWQLRSKRFGPQHYQTADAAFAYARALAVAGKFEPAVAMAETSERIVAPNGPDHPDALAAAELLGWIHLHAGKPAAAQPHLQRALQGRLRRRPASPRSVYRAAFVLALALQGQGQTAEAQSLLAKYSVPDGGWLQPFSGALLAAIAPLEKSSTPVAPPQKLPWDTLPALLRPTLRQLCQQTADRLAAAGQTQQAGLWKAAAGQ